MFKFANGYHQMIFILFSLLYAQYLSAQDCNSLYLITGNDGTVYSITPSSGATSFITTMSSGKQNLAVGPDPLSTGNTVFTTSQLASGATVYKSNTSIGTTLPVGLDGLGANPATTGATAGYVYGVSSSRQLIKVSPAPATNLGTITGDAIWGGATLTSDLFFDDSGDAWVVARSGSSDYFYKINTSTLVATQVVGISGSFPADYQGLAFYDGKIYAAEMYSQTSGLLLFTSTTYYVRIHEINPNSGQSITLSSINLGSSNPGSIDLSSCQVLTPPSGPSCNALYGVVGTTQTIYNIDISTLATSQVTDGNQTNQGNMAVGPIPSNLVQNQFVTSVNDNSGNIYVDINGTGTLTSTGNTLGNPIGLGTDPGTGTVWGISGKTLTKWTGTGNGSTVGTITGDATWTSGTTLNDIAVDAGGNLYCIIFSGTNTYLYRINTTTLVATLVVQANGNYITDGTTTNGNGLAYLGEFFYYSRINGTNTDLWKLNASTGASTYEGSISGRVIGDLGSCGTVTNVPANFSFDCSASGAGIVGAELVANGISQTSVLRVPISGTITGLTDFTISGTGISTSPSPYQLSLEQGAVYADIPIVFDGSSPVGTKSITVASPQATGSCSIDVTIYCAAYGSIPVLSASNIDNVCPTNTVDLNSLVTSSVPAGTSLVWFTNNTATGTAYATPTTAATGATYYAFYYDAPNTCYGSVSAAVTATTVSCCNAGDLAPSLIGN